MIYLFFSVVANYVSLPGAGAGAEPTSILEVLNQSLVSGSDNNEETSNSSRRSRSPGGTTNQPVEATVDDQSTTQPSAGKVENDLSADIKIDVSQQVDEHEKDEKHDHHHDQIHDYHPITEGNVLELEAHLIESGRESSSDIYPGQDISGELITEEATDHQHHLDIRKSTAPSVKITEQSVATEINQAPLAQCAEKSSDHKTSKSSQLESCEKLQSDEICTAESITKPPHRVQIGKIENNQLEVLQKSQLSVKFVSSSETQDTAANQVGSNKTDTGSNQVKIQGPNDVTKEIADRVSEVVQSVIEEAQQIVSEKLKKLDDNHIESHISRLQQSDEISISLIPSTPESESKTSEAQIPVESFPASEPILKKIEPKPREKRRGKFGPKASKAIRHQEVKDLSAEAKKEYYQDLRNFLNAEDKRPPIPLQTYRWEDLRRAKQQGGYPWTHLYKRPLGPNEEPENVLLQRHRSQQLPRLGTDSPKSLKKVRIHDLVLVKETEKYINDLSDNEDGDNPPHRPATVEEDRQSVQSEPTYAASANKQRKKSRGDRLRGILKKAKPKNFALPKIDITLAKDKGTDPEDNKDGGGDSPKKNKCCHPIMDKIKLMADKQLKKRGLKKVPLKENEKISLTEEQKILRLKISPKADRGEIPHFVEKQDSDEILDIVELEESPSKGRKNRLPPEGSEATSILVPDEIIELTKASSADGNTTEEECLSPTPEPTVSEILEEEFKSDPPPPVKAPRKKKEHVYEDIEGDIPEQFQGLSAKIDEILEEAVVGALKRSLASQDQLIANELEAKAKHLEDLGSSEEDHDKQVTHLAPISSVDSTSSEEDRRISLPPVSEEESDQNMTDDQLKPKDATELLKIVEDHEKDAILEVKSALKREPSPSSDKKVTFSHVEDEAEPHREDIELPEGIPAANRWSKMSDHEYEPIGEPQSEQQVLPKEPTPSPQLQEFGSLSEGGIAIIPFGEQKRKAEVEEDQEIKQIRLSEYDEGLTGEEAAHSLQQDIEERYFSSIPTTPRTDSRTDNEIHTSQVDSSAIEELPLKSEARRKGFMASAQDRGKKMQQNIRSHAGKIKSKISGMKKPSGSPKSKEKKRFKAPEFSKMKMPDIKRPEFSKFKAPDMSKLKKMEFKRPDMSKFRNIPERLSSMKKKKEKPSNEEEESELPADFESGTTPESAPSTKKRFEFNFATYPRMLRKKKQKHSTIVIARADDVQSSETPPSLESSTVPRIPRSTKGPVGSKWTDKFSDVSYGGDSESGKYQRYGSEVESIERESSMERRMKEDLERSSREEEELGQIRTEEQRQFADYDEENRAIHEISKTREGEFKKRRPMVHQDSGVSEESKELGWSEKDILRNKILNQNESDQDNGLYPSEEALGDSVTNTNQETQSTGSSNALRQKGVIEEIDDDEFFLRKRGISQDNIEIREYISSAIREGLTTPVNALAKLGTSEEYYPNELDMSNEQMNYGYDVPPPKPRRVKDYNTSDLNVESGDLSQSYDGEGAKDSYEDNFSLPQEDVDFFKGLPPNRPLRKTRHQYSRESQEDHEVPPGDVEYFEDDEKPFYRAELPGVGGFHEVVSTEPPKAPKRRRRQQMRRSVEKEHPYLNGFSGRSVSNSFIPEGQIEPEMIVYRTQHEYIIPLPQVDHFTPPTAPRRSRSRSQVTEDDRTSHGADSLQLDEMQPVEHVEEKFHIEIKENDGYATVRKEPPPRPPAPVRRKRSTNSPRRDFSTLPTQKTTEPEKSTRSYRTIGPSKPPRRKSDLELKEQQKRASSPDVTEYEELDVDYIDDQTESPEAQRDLQSGEVINKMKYRPLPPPPRPPREGRKQKDAGDNKFDKDGGGEKIENNLEHGENENYDIQKTTEKFIEIDVAVQTDPLPEDFVFEEFEITDDMKIIEPRRISKTLEDILKEEQQAEIERAKQLADAEALNRGIQRFRESNQRSFSEKSKTSTDRPRSQSRPTTPSAIVIEKRVPTPIPNTSPRETMLEASLTVQPIDDDYDIEKEIEEELRRDREREIDEQLRRERERVEQERKKREVEEEIERQLQQQYEIENPFEREFAEDTEEPVQAHITPYQEEEQRLIATSHPEENDSEIPIEESDMELPPLPPPRKRSGGHGAEETSADKPKEKSPLSTTTTTVQQETSLIPIHEAIAQEQGIVQSTPPTRLAVADLEVERLSVNALQASRIMVSQLQGASVSADELNCKSGNLVVKNIEFPPGFIEEIVERVRSTDREHSQTQARTVNAPPTIPPSPPLSSPPSEEPPARPPPPQPPLFPSEYMQFSQPPAAFFQLRSPVEDDYQQLPPTHRRRRHHRRRDSSSSEEDAHREHRRSRHSTQSPEPTIGQLSGQLLSACGSSVLRTMNQIVNMLRSSEKTGNERHISTAIVIIILTTLAFLLLGMTGDKNIHHHHWDYFNPPGNGGRG